MTTKIKYIILSFLTFGLIMSCGDNDKRFYNIKIPEELNFEKPIQSLTYQEKDSVENLKVTNEKILIIGDGYSGYDFYIWHKPIEKGYIYIKAYELTQNVQLSECKLSNRTVNKITDLGNEYILYQSNTVIDEGTFEKYYPVRFELWFTSENDKTEKKLAEKKYVIDGWDR